MSQEIFLFLIGKAILSKCEIIAWISFADYRRSKQHMHIAEKLRDWDSHRRTDPDAGSGRRDPCSSSEKTTQEHLDNGVVNLQRPVHEHCLQSQQLSCDQKSICHRLIFILLLAQNQSLKFSCFKFTFSFLLSIRLP